MVEVDEGQPTGLQGRVEVRLMGGELLLDALAGGDVDHHAEGARRQAVRAQHQFGPHPEPADQAVLAPEPHLAVEAPLAGDQGGHRRPADAFAVARE